MPTPSSPSPPSPPTVAKSGGRFKRIILLNVPYADLYGDVDLAAAGALRVPLGVACVTAYVRAHARNAERVRLYDLATFRQPLARLRGILDAERPDLVGISTTTPQMPTALQIARYAKRRLPGLQVIFGGPHPSALPVETASEADVDFVAVGEGEETMLELVQGVPLPDIRGLVWRTQDSLAQSAIRNPQSAIVVNPPRPLIEDLDSLPFPAYEDLPLRKYSFAASPEPTIWVLTGRGCPYTCAFCASHVIFRRRYRLQSIPRVVDQIEHLRRTYGIRTITIGDETFTIDARRVRAFCDELSRRHLGVKWTCATRVDLIDEPLLRHMKRAGCFCVEIGAESGNDEMLQRMQKRITTDQVRRFCAAAKRVGVMVLADFILGHPYETMQSARDTISFAGSLPLDLVQMARCVPLPGTKVWDIVKEGRVARSLASNWLDYRRYGRAIITSDALPADELDRLYGLAWRRTYLRPRFMWTTLRRCVRSPALFVDLLRKMVALLRFMSHTGSRRA